MTWLQPRVRLLRKAQPDDVQAYPEAAAYKATTAKTKYPALLQGAEWLPADLGRTVLNTQTAGGTTGTIAGVDELFGELQTLNARRRLPWTPMNSNRYAKQDPAIQTTSNRWPRSD